MESSPEKTKQKRREEEGGGMEEKERKEEEGRDDFMRSHSCIESMLLTKESHEILKESLIGI